MGKERARENGNTVEERGLKMNRRKRMGRKEREKTGRKIRRGETINESNEENKRKKNLTKRE